MWRACLVAILTALSVAGSAQAQVSERARLDWSVEGADIDLHIWTGRAATPGTPTASRSPMRRSTEDDVYGPGVEFNLDADSPSLRAFTYGVCYYAYNGPASAAPPVDITLTVTDPGSSGQRSMPYHLAGPAGYALLTDSPQGQGYQPPDGWCDSPVGHVPGPPTNLSPPTISGPAIENGALHCQPGTWRDGPGSFDFQWLRDGVALPDATSTDYAVALDDLDHALTCQVTAVTSRGTASATSAPVRPARGVGRGALPAAPVLRHQRAVAPGLEVEQFLTERDGRGRPLHRACSAVSPPPDTRPRSCRRGTEIPLAGAADLFRAPGPYPILDIGAPGQDMHAGDVTSPLPACRQHGLRDCDAGPRTSLYWHAVGTSRYVLLDYWWFLRFNDAPASSTALRVLDNDHEGDWEGMTVALPAADPAAPTFDWVAFASHTHTFKYLRSALSCDGDLAAGSCGPSATRPHDYVANGTHASYPVTCRDRANLVTSLLGGPVAAYALACKQSDQGGESGVPEDGFDGRRPWGANDDPAALRSFGAWVSWAGRWGFPGNAASPGSQGRFRDPSRTACSGRGSAGEAGCDPLFIVPPAGARAHATPAQAAGRRTGCLEWDGPMVASALCDEDLLESAFDSAALDRAGPVSGQSAGRAVASAPGLVQVMGPALEPGERVVYDGSASGARLFVRAADATGWTEARFDDVDLGAGRTLEVAVAKGARGPALTARYSDATVLHPAAQEHAPGRVTALRVRRRTARTVVLRLRSPTARVRVGSRVRRGARDNRMRIRRVRPGRRVRLRLRAGRRSHWVAVQALDARESAPARCGSCGSARAAELLALGAQRRALERLRRAASPW